MTTPHQHQHNREPHCCHDDNPRDSKSPQTIALDSRATGEISTTLNVGGMDCADEVEAIRRVLLPVSGVRDFKVNLMAGNVTINHNPDVTAEILIQAIAKAGLKASRPADRGEHESSPDAQRARVIAVIISGIGTSIGLLLQWRDLFEPYGQIIAFILGIVSGGWFILPKALRALRQFALDMNVLMTVAVVGAACIGEWSEGAAVVFLFALSEALEAFSLNRARRAIQALLKLAPETALLRQDNQVREVPVQEVKTGETISIRSGARIPLDGQVLSGQSAVNQAPITGESMPVEKKPNDIVFAGTINGEGSLEVKVTKAHTDTTLAQIIRLVGEAQGQKAPSQRFVDRFAKVYTPSVFIAALLVLFAGPLLFQGEWSTWIYRSLVLLVIACPCALVISTPVSIVSGLTAMARRGVLIKGGTYLEAIGKLKALAVDKTGTITEGKPRVIKVIHVNAKSDEEILRIAAAIDVHSDHPLALAVTSYAKERHVEFSRSEKYQSKTGRGAEAWIDGHLYFVGNHRFTHELGACSDELEKTLAEIESQAQSVVVVGHASHDGEPGNVLGILAVGDSIRANAAEAIRNLHTAGVEKVIMLSGDNQRTVDAISNQVGIDEAVGNLLPNDKIERVKQLVARHKFAGMIDDGVNDAPAMAAATIGIAMGGAGTDTAIETADITLMQDDLSQVAETIKLGKRTVRIIQANIAFALTVKGIFLLLALFGYTSLWLAILADTGATLLVIANALRLLRVR